MPQLVKDLRRIRERRKMLRNIKIRTISLLITTTRNQNKTSHLIKTGMTASRMIKAEETRQLIRIKIRRIRKRIKIRTKIVSLAITI